MRRKQKSTKRTLSETYYNPERPGSYGGVDRLKRYSGLKRDAVKDWLSYQDAYTLHKPVRYHFPRRRIIVGGIDHQWQADLIDLRTLKKENDGYVYVLTCIDILSKYAWALPLKDKTGQTLVSAFEDIFEEGRKPLKLQTDKGSEFQNRIFQSFLKKRKVEHFVTENEDIKASVVERFNRTLKDKLWRYFTKHNTERFLEALPQLVDAYNRTVHRSIKRAPMEVTRDTQEDVWHTLYDQPFPSTSKKRTLGAGDRVRISKARRNFKKGYMPSWTEELFTVSRVKPTKPLTYVLKDDHGEELEGAFYVQELQNVGEKEVYRIENVLKRRTGLTGRTEYLVKWYGYDSSFNSWIPATALTTYSH